MTQIHPSAIVDPRAELAPTVIVGPYAVIGSGVSIDDGTRIGAHCVIEGQSRIGRDNRIFQFASLGAEPQDKKYQGEPTRLVIGNGNTIREFVTINTGTVQDGGVTSLGDDNWIMAYVHIAHDCRIGSHTIIANATQLGGHVHLDDWVFLGGISGVHQFVRVGAHAMTGFQTRLSQDLPPFITAAGNPAEVTGVNAEGLRRRGFSRERVALVKQMHRLLYREGLTLEQSKTAIAGLAGQVEGADADVALLLDFLAASKRGIAR